MCFEYRDVKLLPRKILQTVAEMHLKVRHELRQGRYDWFRPFFGRHYQSDMIRTNRDLQTVVENSSLVRGGKTKQFRTGKILTFRGNQQITITISSSMTIYESIDNRGFPFIEYDYSGLPNSHKERVDWAKHSSSSRRSTILSLIILTIYDN